MLIRKEKPEDCEIVYSVVKSAFENAECTDGNEHNLVNALRKSQAYISELSLVAEADGKIVGHIMFTKAQIGNSVVLALAPLAVLPEYQEKGMGTALVREGHRIARELGYEYSVVLGSEKYYPKLGYVQADKFDVRPPFDVPSENYMLCKLKSEAAPICGVVIYAKEFGVV